MALFKKALLIFSSIGVTGIAAYTAVVNAANPSNDGVVAAAECKTTDVVENQDKLLYISCSGLWE